MNSSIDVSKSGWLSRYVNSQDHSKFKNIVRHFKRPGVDHNQDNNSVYSDDVLIKMRNQIHKCKRNGWLFGIPNSTALSNFCTDSQEKLNQKYPCPSTNKDLYSCIKSNQNGTYRVFKKLNVPKFTCNNLKNLNMDITRMEPEKTVYKFDSGSNIYSISKSVRDYYNVNKCIFDNNYQQYFKKRCPENKKCTEINDYFEGISLSNFIANHNGVIKKEVWTPIVKNILQSHKDFREHNKKNHNNLTLNNILYNTVTGKIMLINHNNNKHFISYNEIHYDIVTLLKSILNKMLFYKLLSKHIENNLTIDNCVISLKVLLSEVLDHVHDDIVKYLHEIVYPNRYDEVNKDSIKTYISDITVNNLEKLVGNFKHIYRKMRCNQYKDYTSSGRLDFENNKSYTIKVVPGRCLKELESDVVEKIYTNDYCGKHTDRKCITISESIDGETLRDTILKIHDDSFWKSYALALYLAVETFHNDTGRSHNNLVYRNIVSYYDKNMKLHIRFKIPPNENVKLSIVEDLMVTYNRLKEKYNNKNCSDKTNNTYCENIKKFNKSLLEVIKEKKQIH